MVFSPRNVTAPALALGIVALSCGGKVLEPEQESDLDAGGGGAAGASSVGGQGLGGHSTGGYGHGGYGTGGSSTGGYNAGGYGTGGYGTGGKPGTGGSGGAVSACSSPEDIDAISASYDAGTIDGVANSCGYTCISDVGEVSKYKECVSACVKQSTGGKLSTPCADCYGSSVGCMTSNCLAQCVSDPAGPDCASCLCGNNPAGKNCRGEFSVCSGITDPTCAAP